MEEQLTLLDRAILFAVKAHAGAVRRDGHTPYILHCTEAAAIAATMTQEQEVLAARGTPRRGGGYRCDRRDPEIGIRQPCGPFGGGYERK